MTLTWISRLPSFIKSDRRARLQSAVLSGILLALVFPKFNLTWLAWFALIPMFLVLLQPIALSAAFGYTLLFGTVFNAVLLYWVAAVMHRFGFLAWPLAILFYLGFAVFNGLFLAVFGMMARKILKQNYLFLGSYLPTNLQITITNSLLVGTLWVMMEFCHTYLLTGFPWCLLGYGLINYVGLMQVSTITGIYGISFVVCVLNALLAHAFFQKKRQFFLGIAIVLAVLLTGDFVFRAWLDHRHPEMNQFEASGSATEHRAAILQMNIPQDTDWTRAAFDQWTGTLESMLLQSRSEITVMPENPAPFYFPDDTRFTDRLQSAVRRSGSTVIAGVIMSHADSAGRPGVYNSAATLAPDGRLIAEYDKQHLVPFGEYIPLRRYLAFAGKLTNEVSDFTRGEGYNLSEIDGNHAAILICYEVIFPDEVRRFTREGAEVLINITNDGWYGLSAAPYQHFEMSRVRAIENRRYLIRAANTGISAIIDPYGRVTERTVLDQQTVLHGRFEYRTDQTFYVRYGDLFAWLCTAVSLSILILVFWMGRGSEGLTIKG